MDNSTDQTSPIEKRRPKRLRSLLAGIVTYHSGAHSFTCTVQNLSESGARISVPEAVTFPRSLFLIVVRQQIAYEAIAVWRSRRLAGLKFERSISLGQDIDPKFEYLNKLWQGSALRVGGADN